MPIDDAKPSFTAVSIAMSFARSIESDPDVLAAFSRHEANVTRYLLRHGMQSLTWFNWGLMKMIENLPYMWQKSIYDNYLIRGHDERVALRKHTIRSKIEASLASGCEQIIFLGGGYDIRALFTASTHQGVKIFEVDKGATREHKIEGIKTLPKYLQVGEHVVSQHEDGCLQVNDNLYYIEADLTQDDCQAKLEAHGYDPKKKTLIICEGVTAYLGKVENKTLLRSLHVLMSDDSELLISYMSSFRYTSLSEQAYTSSDEKLQFFMSPDSAIQFAATNGFAINQHFSSAFHLRAMGADEAANEFNNTGIHEHYYLMLRSTSKQTSYAHLDEIPLMPVTLKRHESSDAIYSLS